MISNFKSFNEDTSNNDSKFLAIAESVYNDLHDIMIKVPNIKYCVYLIKSISIEGKIFYCINVVMNSYPDNIGKDLISLRSEYENYYNDKGFVFEYCVDGSIKKYAKNDIILGSFGDDFVSKKIDLAYLNDVLDSLMKISNEMGRLNNVINKTNSKLDINKLISNDLDKDKIIDSVNNITKYIEDNL